MGNSEIEDKREPRFEAGPAFGRGQQKKSQEDGGLPGLYAHDTAVYLEPGVIRDTRPDRGRKHENAAIQKPQCSNGR